jgi:arylsulfatase
MVYRPTNKNRTIIKVILIAWVTALAATINAAEKPNILLIFVDDLGYNDLGCYGAKDPAIQTPNLDRMAAEGIRFTDWASGSSVCAPSRASLLTGRYPQRCGLPVCPSLRNFGKDYEDHVGLPPSEITIAEMLKSQGYKTAMFGKSHLGYRKEYYPKQFGFDEYYGSLANFPIGGTCPVMEGDEVVDPAMKYQDIHKKLTDRTVEFMKKSKKADKPFFIYLAHYLVHGPWDPNRQFATDEEWAVYQKQPIRGHLQNGGDKIYPAMVRELDWHVGQVLNALKEQKLDKNTLVIFISDNGPWLPAGSAKPLRGSKFTTLEGGHRVPAIAWWSGKIGSGQVENRLCSSMDVLPTIAGFTGCSLPQDRVVDGIDIGPFLLGDKKAKGHDTFYYYNGLTLEAVRQGPWKLHLPRQKESHVYWHPAGRGGRIATLDRPLLYNLGKEVGEGKDLSRSQPEVMKKMLSLAEDARAELGDWNRKGRDCPVNKYSGNLNQPTRP